MIPRTATERVRQIPKKVIEVEAMFSDQEVRDALVQKYNSLPVGPEEYKIPDNAKLQVKSNESGHYRFSLVWDEEIR